MDNVFLFRKKIATLIIHFACMKEFLIILLD